MPALRLFEYQNNKGDAVYAPAEGTVPESLTLSGTFRVVDKTHPVKIVQEALKEQLAPETEPAKTARLRMTSIYAMVQTLDKMAAEIQEESPVLAMAIDKVSDMLDGKTQES